ncbi:AaceriAAR166Cp [[Ashbya] aceris (nom. inval.)]|nr:AaceriAAR166Cp [[Ashbya] aceris (nom. inval.)]
MAPQGNMENHRTGSQLAAHDVPQFYLLVALYFLQGIPVGLAFGTVPFLLKSIAKDTSFTKLGLFGIATYPYSLKILWSPLVDSVFSKKIGRRRSWIIPIQLASGVMLWCVGYAVARGWVFEGVDSSYGAPSLGEGDHINITSLTVCFLVLVFFCATQDIAVDGWALTILSRQSLSYASTAQTVGLNTGYFLSFSIFLAFNSSDFVNKYFRALPQEHGIISFSSYLKFSGWMYLILTAYVVFFTKEYPYAQAGLPITSTKPKDDDEKGHIVTSAGKSSVPIEYNEDSSIGKTSLGAVYKSFVKVLRLPAVRSLIILHFVSKFPFQCSEGATNLKLLEKGLKKEDLAITVLVDFPFEIIFGYYVAKWSSESNQSHQRNLPAWLTLLIGQPGILTPWIIGYLGRLLASMLGSFVLSQFPEDGNITKGYFILVILQNLLGSFMSTVQFVGVSAFHTRIADPAIGGTYMTLLNTLSNLGGTWSRIVVMAMIDFFTAKACQNSALGMFPPEGKCLESGGKLVILRDGYYITNLLCVTIGLLMFPHIRRKAQHLQSLPISSWRVQALVQ